MEPLAISEATVLLDELRDRLGAASLSAVFHLPGGDRVELGVADGGLRWLRGEDGAWQPWGAADEDD